MCRICKEKQLTTAYEIQTGICLECQNEIAQAEAKLFLHRKFFGVRKWNPSKLRGYLTGKKCPSLN